MLYPAKSESLYYDPLSRLTFALADSFPGDTIRYTYSKVGNRLTKIIGIDTTFYNYSNNKLASTAGNEPAVYRYDNKGNVIVDSTSSKDTLAYNQLNRLLSINGGAKGSYYYDGEGKRVRKDYSNSYVVYLYDQWGNVIAETDIFGNLMCEYIWANGKLIAKIYQDDFYAGFSGKAGIESRSPGPPPVFLEYIFYYHLDHLGTPLALTNVARSIQWSADYLPFGEIYNELIAPVSNEIRFPGQYHDRETGLYYNWHRYYKPTLGRYYRPDPLKFLDPQLLQENTTPYSYASNNPVNFIDPLGLKCRRSFWKRVWYNFVITNEAIPGKFAHYGLGELTATEVARLTSSITFFEWAKRGFAAVTLEGVSFTGTESVIIVGGTALLNSAIVGLAWEVGVGIGSIISAAIFPCEDEFQIKVDCKK